MSNIYSFREGWQSEHLAKFILSKFSFVAEPSTISDDLGADFFCTLFKIIVEGNNKFLHPRNSFAIQIKSIGKKKIDFSKNWSYIADLQIPFFIGIVNRKNLTLTLYSGEHVQYFFSHKGGLKPTWKFFLKLANRKTEKPYGENQNLKESYINFPKIIEIGADFDYIAASRKLDKLFSLCNLIQDNISTKRNEEHTYKLFSGKSLMIAGQGSAKKYLLNFYKRLGETFYNLEWMYTSNFQNKNSIKREFGLFKKIFLLLPESNNREYKNLKMRYRQIKRLMGDSS